MSQGFPDLDDLDSSAIGLSRLKHHLVPTLLSLFGLLFIGFGIYVFSGEMLSDSNKGIEVLESTTESDKHKIIVEVSGAVNTPGVYEMESGARVDDALQKAGGVTDEVDAIWMQRTLNRAAFLQDGQKLFLPSRNQQSVAGSATENGGDQSVSPPRGSDEPRLININTATTSELETLWGIGPVTGQNIIDQRPYSSVEELLSRKILKGNVYETNKDFFVVH